MNKKLAVMLLVWFMVKLSSPGSDIDLRPFEYHENSETDLRASFTKRHGNIPIHRIDLERLSFIYVTPRIRGGGRGIKDIVVYCGNDKIGWDFIFWQRTSFVEIQVKTNDKMLTFMNEKDEVLGSVSMNPDFYLSSEDWDPETDADPFEPPVIKTIKIKVDDVPKLKGIGSASAQSHDAGLALFKRVSDGEAVLKGKPHFFSSGDSACWMDFYQIASKKDQDALIAKTAKLMIDSRFEDVVCRFYEEVRPKDPGIDNEQRANEKLLRAVRLLKCDKDDKK